LGLVHSWPKNGVFGVFCGFLGQKVKTLPILGVFWDFWSNCVQKPYFRGFAVCCANPRKSPLRVVSTAWLGLAVTTRSSPSAKWQGQGRATRSLLAAQALHATDCRFLLFSLRFRPLFAPGTPKPSLVPPYSLSSRSCPHALCYSLSCPSTDASPRCVTRSMGSRYALAVSSASAAHDRLSLVWFVFVLLFSAVVGLRLRRKGE